MMMMVAADAGAGQSIVEPRRRSQLISWVPKGQRSRRVAKWKKNRRVRCRKGRKRDGAQGRKEGIATVRWAGWMDGGMEWWVEGHLGFYRTRALEFSCLGFHARWWAVSVGVFLGFLCACFSGARVFRLFVDRFETIRCVAMTPPRGALAR